MLEIETKKEGAELVSAKLDGIEGIKLYKEMIDYCRAKGMVVMADVKRGDIGSTSAGYSRA